MGEAPGVVAVLKLLADEHIDPNLVQEAIDAIQGRRPTTTNTMGRPGGGGQGGFQRPGGGGFGAWAAIHQARNSPTVATRCS